MAERIYRAGLVGEQHYMGAAAAIGEAVSFRLEPDNPHDEDAIAVVNKRGETLGYIASDNFLQDVIHEQGLKVTGVIESISAGDAMRQIVLSVVVGGSKTSVFTGSYAPPAAPSAADRKSPVGKQAQGCLALVVIAGLVALVTCSGDKEGVAPAGPPISATAAEIFDAYQANEASAQQRFGNRTVTITGTVAEVDLDFGDNPIVRLETSNQFMSMGLKPDEESAARASELAKGQGLTATCVNVHEIAGTPYAEECQFP